MNKGNKFQDDASLLDKLARRGTALRWTLLLCAFLFACNVVSPIIIIYLLNEPHYVANVDDNDNIIFARLKNFRDSQEIYSTVARTATKVMLSRNPGGLDESDMTALIFAPQALQKLQKYLDQDSAIFNQYSYHQKVELGQISLTKQSDDTVKADVQFLLTRLGAFNGRARTQVIKGNLTLFLFRNKDIAINKKYPAAVWDFDITLDQAQ
jgi:hypothetical protein